MGGNEDARAAGDCGDRCAGVGIPCAAAGYRDNDTAAWSRSAAVTTYPSSRGGSFANRRAAATRAAVRFFARARRARSRKALEIVRVVAHFGHRPFKSTVALEVHPLHTCASRGRSLRGWSVAMPGSLKPWPLWLRAMLAARTAHVREQKARLSSGGAVKVPAHCGHVRGSGMNAGRAARGIRAGRRIP